MRKLILMIALAASMAVAAQANATLVSITYTNDSVPASDTVHASAMLGVEGGQAISGTGTISGGGLVGTLPMNSYIPGGRTGTADRNPGRGLLSRRGRLLRRKSVLVRVFVRRRGYGVQRRRRDSRRCGWNLIPGGRLRAQLRICALRCGGRHCGRILVGDAPPQPSIEIVTQGGVLEARTVPEPASLALLGVGVIATGVVGRRRS